MRPSGNDTVLSLPRRNKVNLATQKRQIKEYAERELHAAAANVTRKQRSGMPEEEALAEFRSRVAQIHQLHHNAIAALREEPSRLNQKRRLNHNTRRRIHNAALLAKTKHTSGLTSEENALAEFHATAAQIKQNHIRAARNLGFRNLAPGSRFSFSNQHVAINRSWPNYGPNAVNNVHKVNVNYNNHKQNQTNVVLSAPPNFSGGHSFRKKR